MRCLVMSESIEAEKQEKTSEVTLSELLAAQDLQPALASGTKENE